MALLWTGALWSLRQGGRVAMERCAATGDTAALAVSPCGASRYGLAIGACSGLNRMAEEATTPTEVVPVPLSRIWT